MDGVQVSAAQVLSETAQLLFHLAPRPTRLENAVNELPEPTFRPYRLFLRVH